MKILFPVLIFALIIEIPTFGQEVIAKAGKHQTEFGVQLIWTLGVSVISTLKTSQTNLTQGFHQPKLTVTAINNLPLQNLALRVYPNPTSDYVTLEIIKGEFKNLQYSLFELSGKLLLKKNALTKCEQLGMHRFSSGIYLLKISTLAGQPLQTFKLIKK